MISPDFPTPVTETYTEPDTETKHVHAACCWCGTLLAPGMVVSESLKTMRRLCADCRWDIEASAQEWMDRFRKGR